MTAEKVLTEKLVLEKTKVGKLEDVQRLDLWGEGLTDISFVQKLPNLEVLSLAANNISSLKVLRKCTSLQELYLRKNKISRLREVSTLSGMPRLTVLWMMDNPCAQHTHYRDFVLHCCQGLRQLDSVEITDAERKAAAKRLTSKVLDEILERKPASASTPLVDRKSSSGGTTPQESSSASVYSTRERNAIAEEASANGHAVLFTTVAAQRAMLLSIVSLLPELTVESLELLQREVQERLEKQKEKVTKLTQDSTQ
jgi:cilla- and flagella-associated protein